MSIKMSNPEEKSAKEAVETNSSEEEKKKNPAHKLEQADGEIGGPNGLEPTRYGDWERKGIISDF